MCLTTSHKGGTPPLRRNHSATPPLSGTPPLRRFSLKGKRSGVMCVYQPLAHWNKLKIGGVSHDF